MGDNVKTMKINGITVKFIYPDCEGSRPFIWGKRVSPQGLAIREAEVRMICLRSMRNLVDIASMNDYRMNEDSPYGEIIRLILNWKKGCRSKMSSNLTAEWAGLYEILDEAKVEDLVNNVILYKEGMSRENHGLLAEIHEFMSICRDELVYGTALESCAIAETDTTTAREVFLPESISGTIYILLLERKRRWRVVCESAEG